MKTALKLGLVLILLLLAAPVAAYRTVRPCEMLRKELVRDTERTLEAARDSVRQAAQALGSDARDAVDEVASTVQHLTAGLAAGAAAAKVERMSARQCATELVRNKLGRD